MARSPVTLRKPQKQSPVSNNHPDRIPVRPGQRVPDAYVFVHYPQCWEYDYTYGHGWIPFLCKVVSKRGCNGVGPNGSLAPVLQTVALRGGTVIDPTDPRLIEPGTDRDTSEWYNYPAFFLTDEPPGIEPRRYWVEPGAEPTITLGRTVLWDKEQIKETSRRFRAYLRDANIVIPMHELTLTGELHKEQERVRRLATKVGANPHLAKQLAKREARLVEMTEAFTAMQTAQLKAGTKIKKTRATRAKRKPKTDGSPATDG